MPMSISFLQVFTLAIGLVILKLFYNVFLHPLRSYPGPLLARASILTSQKHILKGTTYSWIKELHDTYGPIVRVAPNELSIIEPEIWKDVYGHRGTAFAKDKKFYGPDSHGKDHPGMMRADNVSHARQRKLVSHAFSDKALRAQEDLFKTYVGTLIQQLSKRETVNMVTWYDFTTFDIMSDLTFGETFGQLIKSEYHPWVQVLFSYLKVVSVARVCRQWPGLTWLLSKLIPASTRAKGIQHIKFGKERVDERMARETTRPDIWTFVMKNQEAEGASLTTTELHANGALFMIAGTETTSTTLSGLTFHLLQKRNSAYYERLKKEVRDAFSSFDDINMVKLAQLPFLNACLEEILRIFPPVPLGLGRVAPPEGGKVCGRWIPGGTTVSSPIYSLHRSSLYWTNPTKFAPERWLPEGAKVYGSDRKDAFNPFSQGPRGCLGKSLAYHEMRVIFASLMLYFDMQLCNETENWTDVVAHIIWAKKPLHVKLKNVRALKG